MTNETSSKSIICVFFKVINLQTMGCTLSGIEDANREKRELETYVTAEDIRLVKESWKIVGQDLDGAGMMVFHK